jgi:hypothetical protein
MGCVGGFIKSLFNFAAIKINHICMVVNFFNLS